MGGADFRHAPSVSISLYAQITHTYYGAARLQPYSVACANPDHYSENR